MAAQTLAPDAKGRAARWVPSRGAVRYISSRVGQAVLAAFVIYLVVFVVVTVLPGDPVRTRLADPQAGYSKATIDSLLAYYHLDQGVWAQLGWSLQRLLLHGDWGISLQAAAPVWKVIASGLPSTLQLASTAFVLAAVFAFVISLGAFYLPAKFGGGVLAALPSLFLSAPNFLIGLLLINVFAFQLGLFKITDYDGLSALIFPAITLAIPVSAPIAQVMISSLEQARDQQYSTVAVSKGVGRVRLLLKHWLPNAALPAITIAALIAGELLGGAVLTETVFGRNGLGKVIEGAATTQDVPVLQAVVTLAAVIFLTINLLVDLTYPLLDPRIRKAGAAR